MIYYPRTLTTFLFPFPTPEGPAVCWASACCCFMASSPALTASINRPLSRAGDTSGNRSLISGHGSGGCGRDPFRRFLVGTFLDVEACWEDSAVSATVLCSGLGTRSGRVVCRIAAIASSKRFSGRTSDGAAAHRPLHILVFILCCCSLPSFLNDTRTRPGLSQSRG